MKRITLFALFGVAVCRLFAQQDIADSAHQFVDMGLPSGTKWATCNIGATKPEEYGWYVMWGSIEDCSNITCSEITCKTYGMVLENISGDENFDIARKQWGGQWRIPTQEEWEELISNSYTFWTTVNGVNGRLLRSTKNGNTIFLPAAGRREGSSVSLKNQEGRYWAATLDKKQKSSQWAAAFARVSPGVAAVIGGYWTHHVAFSVRAVQ